jgi:O-antigen/teichoic acid export membrane protein
VSQSAETLDGRAALGLEVPHKRGTAHAHLKPMIGGASLVLGGTVVWQASNFVFNAVGAHALGPARYGVLAASLALLSFAGPLLAAVQATASREASSLAASRNLTNVLPMLRFYGLRVACAALALAGIAAATSSWISRLFHLGSPWLVVIIGAAIPGYVISHLLGGLLQGIERFGRFALESVVEGSAKAFAGIVTMGLLWRSPLSGAVTIIVSCVAGLVTYLLVTLPILDRITPSPNSDHRSVANRFVRFHGSSHPMPGHERAGVANYSATALVTYSLLALMFSSDTLVAKHYLSSNQAGLYAGVSLTGKIAYYAASALFVVGFPLFSRKHDRADGTGKWILPAFAGLVCAITGAIVTVFALEPAWVVIPLLGDRYRAVEGYIPWMAAVFGTYTLGFLVSVYMLAHKRRSVIAVLTAAVFVEFAGFFAFHSTITSMLRVLAVAFGVMFAGGLLLTTLGGGRETGRRVRPGAHARNRHSPEAVVSPTAAVAVGKHSRAPGSVRDWREQIVKEIVQRVGSVPVLLAGSRAVGTDHSGSDYDIVVVLPFVRIPLAISRLSAAAGCLTTELGAHVSINPVPSFRMRRPGTSLFVRKLQCEGAVLQAPPGWTLHRRPLTTVTKFAATSVLLSATLNLLETFDTSAMSGGPVPHQAGRTLRKAALHVAQVSLLRSGCYASDLETALARLRRTPASVSRDVAGAELAAALTSALASADVIEGFVRLRQCILGQMAEISEAPLRLPIAKSLIRNAQYAALAVVRGRNRWRFALRRTSVEASLASTLLALLRALDPHSPDGLDAGHFRLAIEALPARLAALDTLSWEVVRDIAMGEWPDAHPLMGVLS